MVKLSDYVTPKFTHSEWRDRYFRHLNRARLAFIRKNGKEMFFHLERANSIRNSMTLIHRWIKLPS